METVKIFGRWTLPTLLLAVALRIGLLSVPAFSTDTNRFLSDGINVAAGKNPYTAPAQLEIRYAHLRSFYPPLQELVFGAIAAISAKPLAFKIFAGLAEMLFLIWYWRRVRGRPGMRLVILFLLFNPISLHEIWREGHVDHVGIFLLYFSIINIRARFIKQPHRARSFIYSCLSIGWKFTGILSILYYYPRTDKKRFMRSVWRLANPYSMGLMLFLVLQLFPAIIWTPFAESGLLVYTNYWHHGNGIIHLLESLGFSAAHGVYLVQRGIIGLFALAAVTYSLGRWSYYNALYFALGTMLVLFPVQHPWYYFLLFVPALLSRGWRRLSMLVCCLTPLTYLGYTDTEKSVGFVIICGVWFGGSIIHFTRQVKYQHR
jgi:hypothetical protein